MVSSQDNQIVIKKTWKCDRSGTLSESARFFRVTFGVLTSHESL